MWAWFHPRERCQLTFLPVFILWPSLPPFLSSFLSCCLPLCLGHSVFFHSLLPPFSSLTSSCPLFLSESTHSAHLPPPSAHTSSYHLVLPYFRQSCHLSLPPEYCCWAAVSKMVMVMRYQVPGISEMFLACCSSGLQASSYQHYQGAGGKCRIAAPTGVLLNQNGAECRSESTFITRSSGEPYARQSIALRTCWGRQTCKQVYKWIVVSREQCMQKAQLERFHQGAEQVLEKYLVKTGGRMFILGRRSLSKKWS